MDPLQLKDSKLNELDTQNMNELSNTPEKHQELIDTAQHAIGKVFEDMKNGKIKSIGDIFKSALSHVDQFVEEKKALAANPETETKTLPDGTDK